MRLLVSASAELAGSVRRGLRVNPLMPQRTRHGWGTHNGDWTGWERLGWASPQYTLIYWVP